MKKQVDANFSFYDVFPDLSPLVIVDVGALPLEGHDEVYAPLLKSKHAELIGFEANPEGCRALNEKLSPPHQCLPFVIGDGQKGVFHKTAHPSCNSLYLESLIRPEFSILH